MDGMKTTTAIPCKGEAKEPQIDMVMATLMKNVRENEALIGTMNERLCTPTPTDESESPEEKPATISAAIAMIALKLNANNNSLARLNDRISDEVGNLKVVG